MSPLLLAACLLAGSACVALTGPAQRWSVAIAEPTPTSRDQDYSEPVVSIEGSTVRIEGWVLTPNPCYEVTATVAATAGRVDIRISQRDPGRGCVLSVAEHDYVVEGRLPPGTYDLRMVYNASRRGQTPATMLETRIQVD